MVNNTDFINSLATSVGDVIVSIVYSTPAYVYDSRDNNVAFLDAVNSWSGGLVSYSSHGTFNWAARVVSGIVYGGPFELFNTVAIGTRDEVVVSGQFKSAALQFYDSTGRVVRNMSTSTPSDIFAAKFRRNGGQLNWLVRITRP